MSEEEKRRTGRTTRIVDQCIQELFTEGVTKVVDHTNNHVSNSRLWKRLLHRLSFEHNCYPKSDLEIDGDILKLNRGN